MTTAHRPRMVAIPSVAHKGPHDTDAKFFREVANRLDAGYGRELGGSNVCAAVATLLRLTADALDVSPLEDPERSVCSEQSADDKVIGWIMQCAVCPQRVVLATPPAPGWVCPRCAEVAVVVEPGGVGDPVREYAALDEWPVSKVRG